MLRDFLVRLVVRKDPNVGYYPGVGSLLSSRVTVWCLSCCRYFRGCGPSWGVIFCNGCVVFLVDCDDVALRVVNRDDYMSGLVLIGCRTNLGY